MADSLSLRSFLDLELTEAAPDHSTLSRTRRRIDVETHEAVFTWVLERLSAAGLVRGKTVGIDAATLEANAAMRSIERRDTGESPRGVHSAVGGGVRGGDADAGGSGSVRPVSEVELTQFRAQVKAFAAAGVVSAWLSRVAQPRLRVIGSTGIGDRFRPESVIGLDRNQ